MFWIFLLIVSAAIGLVKLGSLTVMVGVLSLALKLVIVVTAILLAAFLWRFVRRS